tara:strand:- start:160 stop:459 length:300 start_codon:yes stop_codon:yes gene_type:complete
MNKIKALQSLKPNAQWVIRDDVIEWIDTVQTQPTDAEITAEISRLQAEYDSKQYARDRAEAYPSLTEQADMAYWDRQNNTTTLDDAISAVKTTYPKTGV